MATGQPPDCSAEALTGVPRTADAIVAHLEALPGLRVVDRGSIELGDRIGQVLDLELDPGWTAACPFSEGQPFRSLVMFADEGEYGGIWGIRSGTRKRIVLIDVAPQRVASIWIEATADRFEAFLRQAMPVVETMRFHDPAAHG